MRMLAVYPAAVPSSCNCLNIGTDRSHLSSQIFCRCRQRYTHYRMAPKRGHCAFPQISIKLQKIAYLFCTIFAHIKICPYILNMLFTQGLLVTLCHSGAIWRILTTSIMADHYSRSRLLCR